MISDRATRRALLWAAVIAAWLSVEHWILGPYSQINIHETADITVPQWLYLASRVFSGAGRWIPNFVCGIDRLANDLTLDQPALWIFAVLPGWLAWGAAMFLHSFLEAFGVQRLCARRLKLSEDAAALAGAVAALGYTQAYDLKNAWGYSLLPFVLWGFEEAGDRPRIAFWAAVLGGAAYGLCSSAPITHPFGLAAIPVWLWFRRRFEGRSLGMYVLFAAAAIAARYPVLTAMWAEAPLSQRSFRLAGSISSASLFAYAPMLAFFAPAAALGAWGLWTERGDDRLRRALAVLLGYFAFAAFVAPQIPRLGDALGILRSFNFGRLIFAVPIWAGVCAGLGLEKLKSGARRIALALVIAAFILQSLPDKLTHAGQWLYQGSYTAIFRAAWPRSLPPMEDRPYRVVTVPHGMDPAFAGSYGLESADGYVLLYPERYHRYWREVVRAVVDRDPGYRDDLLAMGNDLYLYLRTVPADGSPINFSGDWRLDLLSLANVRFVVSRYPVTDPNLKEVRPGRAPEMGGRRERLAARLRRNFGLEDSTFIYENTAALPRAFVAPRAVTVATQDEAFARLRSATARELRESVVVEGTRSAPPRGRSVSYVRFVSYGTDRIELDVNGAGPGVLFISNPWTPRWRVSVDGIPAELRPAWGAFQAVLLSAPARSVVLTYR